ncbi:MAG: hypothetical protein QW279_15425 [Candidatus Jordarchaeaceae archaeon]
MSSSNTSTLENECIIEGEFDRKIAIGFAKAAILEVAKIYGPIFTRLVTEYARAFLEDKLKEKIPEDVQGLDAVINYIVANLNRYPEGQCALIYGLRKTVNRLEGGGDSRRAAYGAMKSLFESAGMLKNVVGTTENAYDALKLLPVKEMKQVTRYHYIRGVGKNEVTAIYSNCPYKDTCRAIMSEGMQRIIGGQQCIFLNCGLATVEIVTKKSFDYALEEFDTPDCKGRIFEV